MRPKTPAAAVAALALCTLAACGGSSSSGEAALTAVGSVDQVMDAIVVPSSQAIFDAVIYENGALVQGPKTDDDWFRLQMHAVAVAEAGNLLLIAPRAKDGEEWTTFARQMTSSGADVLKAAEQKDVEGVLKTGGELYRACAGCHERYLPGE